MDLEEVKALIIAEHSKHNSRKVTQEIENGNIRLEQLQTLISGDEKRVVQISASCINEYLSIHTDHIQECIPALLIALDKDLHPSVPRNFFRVLQFIELPETYESQILDLAYTYMLDPGREIAARVFAMQVIFNLTKKYPELKQELLSSIDLIEAPSKGLCSRMKKIRKALLT